MEKIKILREIEVDGARVLVLEVLSEVEDLLTQFSSEDVKSLDYERYVSAKRKLEYLGARWGLKYLTNSLEVVYDQKGKPMLKDGNYQISISHSARWIALIVHPTMQVGIDIERRSSKILNVFSRFLSVDEQKVFYNGDTDLRKLQIAWSAKEAVYKIVGQEAIDFASQLRVCDFQIASSGTLEVVHISTMKSYNLIYAQTADYTLVYVMA